MSKCNIVGCRRQGLRYELLSGQPTPTGFSRLTLCEPCSVAYDMGVQQAHRKHINNVEGTPVGMADDLFAKRDNLAR